MELLAALGLAAVCVVACELVGAVGSLWTSRNLAWFYQLKKPRWTPPGYLIGLIWTILFFLIGVALFLVLEQGLAGADIAIPLAVFIAQFALNVAWNYLFFGLRSPLYGLAGIIALWALIILTIMSFWSVAPWAGILLVPYIVWVSIASVLNASIFVNYKIEG